MISTTNTMETAGLQSILTKDTAPAANTTTANTTAADTTFSDWLKAIDNQVTGTNYVDKTNIFTGEVMHNYPEPVFKPTPAETAADAMTPEEQASALVDNYLKYNQTENGQRGAVNPAGGGGYNTSDWAQSFILEPRVGYNTANILLEAVRSGKITDHIPADKIDSMLASLTGATSSTTSAAASQASATNAAANTATTATDGSSQATLASASDTSDAASQTQQDLTQILKDILDGIAKLEAAIQSSTMSAANTTNTTNTTVGSNNSNAPADATQPAQTQTSKTVDLNQILGYNILDKLFNTNNGGGQGYLA